MQLNIKAFYGGKLAAQDGEIGHVKDFYFDDKSWVIRYMVADTGSWLNERLVLLSPHAFGKWDQAESTFHMNLRKAQIEKSPPIASHAPVSRQYEEEYYRYYGWPAYWNGDAMWGAGSFPMALNSPAAEMDRGYRRHHHRADKHLQSAQAVKGYVVLAPDGVIGHVGGFLIDDRSWAIRELVVDNGAWLSRKEVEIPPASVDRISYEDSTVFVNLARADIEQTAAEGKAKSSFEDSLAKASLYRPAV